MPFVNAVTHPFAWDTPGDIEFIQQHDFAFMILFAFSGFNILLYVFTIFNVIKTTTVIAFDVVLMSPGKCILGV